MNAAGALAPEGPKGKEALLGGGYEWVASDSPTFFTGRHADILMKGTVVGEFGVIHPEVLANFDIPNPVTALELNIEPFCFDQMFSPLPTHAR